MFEYEKIQSVLDKEVDENIVINNDTNIWTERNHLNIISTCCIVLCFVFIVLFYISLIALTPEMAAVYLILDVYFLLLFVIFRFIRNNTLPQKMEK